MTKIMCEFEAPAGPLENTIDGVPASSASVVGSVLLSLLEPSEPGVVRLQARLTGLDADSEHSFHFHEWGDMTVGEIAPRGPPISMAPRSARVQCVVGSTPPI